MSMKLIRLWSDGNKASARSETRRATLRMAGTVVGRQWEFPSGGHSAGSYLAAGGHSAFPDGSLFLIGPGGS